VVTPLLKCKLMSILDDPFAAFATSIGVAKAAHATRFEDRMVLPQLIEQLERSADLTQFYGRLVKFPNGESGRLNDVAGGARSALKEEEDRYVNHVRTICEQLVCNNGQEKYWRPLSPSSYAGIIGNVTTGLTNMYSVGKFEDANLRHRIIASTFLYAGYCVARADEYLTKAKGNIAALGIKRNDAEDSAMCLHLNLFEPCTFVTDDKGTIRAVKRALCRLKQHLSDQSVIVDIRFRIINTLEFKERISAI
jgi:hypothetical protein